MKITPGTWNDILTLMASVLLIDETVLENEVQSFQKNARLLANEIGQPIDMDDELLKHWFEIKREDIARSISSEDADEFVIKIALSLEKFPVRESLLRGLINISASDADMDRRERNILNLAAAYWGLPLISSYRS